MKNHLCAKYAQGDFTTKQRLSTRLLVHSGKKTFTCDVCNKSITTKEHLNYHKLNHSGEKTFMCEVCNKGFTTKQRLNTHISSQW